MKNFGIIVFSLMLLLSIGFTDSSSVNQTKNNGGNLLNITGYPIVSTNQTVFYNNVNVIGAPS
ncbi:MAG: hypothetical protein WC055_14010 [Melioribacteraceae bacterium]